MSNKIMLSIVLAITLTGFSACKKFLDLPPKTDIGETEALNSKDRIQRALTGTYSALQSDNYYGFEWMNAVWLSDDNVTPFSAGTTDLQFDTHNVLASSNTMEGCWAAMYRTINSANNVIDAVNQIKDESFTQEEKQNISGQAYFIRGLVYFDMVRTWGGVPLVLSPTRGYDSSSNKARSTIQEVYVQILDDLNQAETRLPESLNRNIATKKASQALKARLYLYQKDWTNAELNASKLIDDRTEYSLVEPYDNLITLKNNKESIFELSYSPSDQNPLANVFFPQGLGGTYRIGPTKQMIDLMNAPNVAGGRSGLIAVFDGEFYGNRYRAVASNAQDDDVVILQLSEMYLIRAEARAHLQNLSGGLADLNVVRKRAQIANADAQSGENLLLLIESERRIEFAFQPQRWFDLIRTGRAAAVLGITDSHKLVFPIPTSEIVANNALIQNEGY